MISAARVKVCFVQRFILHLLEIHTKISVFYFRHRFVYINSVHWFQNAFIISFLSYYLDKRLVFRYNDQISILVCQYHFKYWLSLWNELFNKWLFYSITDSWLFVVPKYASPNFKSIWFLEKWYVDSANLSTQYCVVITKSLFPMTTNQQMLSIFFYV